MSNVDDQLKPIGWEWAQDPRNPRVLGDDLLLAAEREPCPVCGHPTGDCAGGHVVEKRQAEADPSPAAKPPEPMEDSPPAETAPQHTAGNRLLDASHGEAKELKAAAIVDSDGYVKQDVYEEVQTPLAKRMSYRLAYVKGQQLSREQRATLK